MRHSINKIGALQGKPSLVYRTHCVVLFSVFIYKDFIIGNNNNNKSFYQITQ